MLSKLNSIYSPESISFQNPAFHLSLTKLIQDNRENQDNTGLEIKIAECIKKYTNLNFEIHIGNYPMCVEIPQIDQNNPVIEGYGVKNGYLSKRGLSDIRKDKGNKVTGMIDPDSSYVGGYFAEMTPIKMYLNEAMVFKNPVNATDSKTYTAGEVSAAILHEVGHVWTYLYFIVRFRTDNQMMNAMVRDLDGTTDQNKREIIIMEAAKGLDVSVDALDLAQKQSSTVYTVMVANMARKNKSQSGTGYDITSYEALADQFASRHGASRDLVTALDKLSVGTIYRRGTASYAFFEFVKVAFILGGVLIPGANILTSIGIMTMFMDSHNELYDKTGYRFKRIKHDLIEQLKDQSLDKVTALRIQQDIDTIDEVNKRYKDYTQLTGLIYDYLLVPGINKRKNIEFQQQLEEMAKNRLFQFSSILQHA